MEPYILEKPSNVPHFTKYTTISFIFVKHRLFLANICTH